MLAKKTQEVTGQTTDECMWTGEPAAAVMCLQGSNVGRHLIITILSAQTFMFIMKRIRSEI